MKIQEALALGDNGVISLIGGGGKTSLMYSLARELVSSGKRVLTTTTTKIFMPACEESQASIISKTSDEIIIKAKALLDDFPHITLGAEYLPTHDKISGLQVAVLEDIHRANLFDFIVVEADGAARRSLKACAPHEPVVPDFTDLTIALIGLDVVGKPLTEKWVFRSDLFSEVTGLGLLQEVTESSIVSMLLHDISSVTQVGRQSATTVFLNKADNKSAMISGERIADLLSKSGSRVFNRVIIGQLGVQPVIHQCRML